ncbi:PD-(D/E)XK nuclease-like domain-containing protein [Actinomyces bowdenii]|uniref:PD-(D/E)XK nuclease-like domain-containing protein n=1 Tax=Actinomyces bowdenii TaxID=131109 RepID=UPI00214AB57B|nr:PD-(D/E)XK nuclease-like domain-containing protein [Actinomyces bowdenii]MCR2051474.1 PD-(D/E)XK nuclease-like domain-containing protein [Actinomyces bowdenii]
MAYVITDPGTYPGIDERDYHADPVKGGSLSSTEAKLILEAPAVLRWRRENPQQSSAAFDFGTAVHSMVLGAGAPIMAYPEEVLSANGAASTKAAREWAEAVRAAGAIPVKEDTYRAVEAVAEAVRTNPLAARILAAGEPEVSVFARHPETGIWMRGRIDWVMPAADGDGARTLVDLKTTDDANPSVFAHTAARFGYDIQRAWYLKAWELATGEQSRFLHIAVSKKEPHLVSVCEMNWAFDDLGRSKVDKALRLYRDCMERGEWPGIPSEIHQIIPPVYYLDSEEE